MSGGTAANLRSLFRGWKLLKKLTFGQALSEIPLSVGNKLELLLRAFLCQISVYFPIHSCICPCMHIAVHRISSNKGLLPLVILRFWLSWYGSQECLVRWGLCSLASFGVSNGVHQGSILSPFLFVLYLDGLLSELVECGVGCHWGNLFAGRLCYADAIVLLAPCPSALRMMLDICCDYASCHGLELNASETQLICFRQFSWCSSSVLNGLQLHFSDEVSHLGHILTFNLHNKNDIIRATKDLS